MGAKQESQGNPGLVTQAKFAELHQVSRKTVTIWKAAGYLVLVNGLVDVDASDDRLRGAKLGRYRGGPGPAVEGNASDSPARPAATKRPVSDDPPPAPTQTLSEFIDNLLAGNFATVAEAEQIKANALAATRVQEWKERSGALIDIRAAEGAFFDLARSLRDAWLNWPARVGPVLAAEIGAEPDKVVEALTQHVQHHLDQLGEPEIDLGGDAD